MSWLFFAFIALFSTVSYGLITKNMKKMSEEVIKQISIGVGFALTAVLIFFSIWTQFGRSLGLGPTAQLMRLIFLPYDLSGVIFTTLLEDTRFDPRMMSPEALENLHAVYAFFGLLYFCLAFCLFFRITQFILRRRSKK